MMQSFLIMLEQVGLLALTMLLGFLCGKLRLIREEGIGTLNGIILNIVIPATMISSFQRSFDRELLTGFLILLAVAVIGTFSYALVAALTLRDKKAGRQSVYRLSVIFSNCGFIGIPLQQAILGANGVFYGTAFVVSFNLLAWTLGLYIISRGKEKSPLKTLLLNPAIIAAAVSIALFVFSVQLPPIVKNFSDNFAQMSMALPALVIGYRLSQVKKLGCLKDKNSWLAAALRLVLLPAATIFALKLLGLSRELLIVATIAVSTPAATVMSLLAERYKADSALSVELLSVQTVLSIFTMPAMLALAQLLADTSLAA